MQTQTHARYAVVPAPKFAGMMEHDCACCGHEGLRRAVFLSDGGAGAAPYGPGCAAALLYGRRDKRSVRRAVDAQSLADREAENWAREAQMTHAFYAAQGAPTRLLACSAYGQRNPSLWGRPPQEPEVIWTNGERWFGWCRVANPAFAARLAELGWREG